jgi:hypothetical protein
VAEVDGTVAGFTDLEPDGHLNMMFMRSFKDEAWRPHSFHIWRQRRIDKALN